MITLKFQLHALRDGTIRLLILTNGNWLPVAQLGPEFLLLGVAADHPPCDAVVKLESNSFAFSCYRTAR